MKFQQNLRYFCTPQVVRDRQGRIRQTYRFNVLDVSGRQPRLICVVNDICSSESEARRLEEYFRRNQISAKHIMDVLEDWVTR